ncbi:MAG TPA: hypothetical protein VF528_09695 [Pyrinomonadaceae bacterium]|jgi:hypothetical protein
MEVKVHWTNIPSFESPLWSLQCVLYAFFAPKSDEALYVGKADFTTVKKRYKCKSKKRVRDLIKKKRGFDGWRVFVGDICLEPGRRFSSELLSDIESLLIINLQPCGNDKALKSRISRPDLIVRCRGAWPSKKKIFRDIGNCAADYGINHPVHSAYQPR